MESYSDKIQDYIDGLLAGEELGEFERQMQDDSELRNMVSLQKEVHEILNTRVHSKEIELRHNLQKSEHKVRFGAVRNVIKFKTLAAIAAICIAVFFGGLWLFRNDANLYELPKMSSEIVRGEEPIAHYEDAVKLFNDEKYVEARVLLASLLQNDKLVQYEYYWSLTFIGAEDWEGAIINLMPVASGTSLFADEAKYYIGVAYAKSGQNNLAIKELQKIPSTGKLGEKAAKLLDELH